jgi:hypothetical protein
MRFRILSALVRKEARRHIANRGGIALSLLLVVAALLLSVFNPATAEAGAGGGDLIGGVHHCYIEYASKTELVAELKAQVPAELQAQLVFREVPPAELTSPMNYQPGTGAIRISESSAGGTPRWGVDVWHPPGDPGAMAQYEQWIFRAIRQAMQSRAAAELAKGGGSASKLAGPKLRDDDLWAVAESFRTLNAEFQRLQSPAIPPAPLPQVEIRRNGLGAKPLDYRSAIATAMIVFALYFACCYLLPTLNCEERERGVLLAQALSPASPTEIVAAKFLFYPVAGMGLAAALAGIYSPNVLSSLFFWLALLAMSGGFLGIGMTVSTLARSQRGAFMGSMCYLLAVSLILLICSQNRIPLVPYLALEFHGPRILHAAVTQHVEPKHWYHLIATFALAASWMGLAAWLFRRRGWQ